MFKVQFRGVTGQERIPLDETVYLKFDPRLSAKVRIRPRESSAKYVDYQVVPEDGIADIVADNPDASTIVVYLKELRQ
jgi:hypothetical protein